jgi:[acyl-carrier-protein] S-malonyltransferase
MSDLAFIFPGQGAQKVGMGRDLVEAYPAAREVFAAANTTLGIELDKLCFEGPMEKLSRSDITQPAILTVSVAAMRCMDAAADGRPPLAACAGHSLGEYTALVGSGMVEFHDAVRLVRARGRFMQEACDAAPGTMYAIIGLDDEQVEQACEQARDETGAGVWPANYNSPGQVVISGEQTPADRAAELCDEMGARRALPLKVAGAFHTPLMQPAADKLEAELQKVRMHEPSCPVVANVTGEPVTDPAEMRELLLKQVTHPVRWTSVIQRCRRDGVDRFVEIGPGRVLAGLLRRIDREADCTGVGGAEDVAEWAAR